MKIKLLTKVENLGQAGDIIETSDAYARNYLIPKKIALAITPSLMVSQEQAAVRRQKKDIKRVQELNDLIKQLAGSNIRITLAASPQGTLFAALKSADIKLAIERHFKVKLPEFKCQPDHLKNLGSHLVIITFNQNFTASIIVTITHG